jgi:hypothetical protein
VRVEERVEIALAPEEIWAFIANPANDPKWCPKVKAVEPAGDGRWNVWHKPIPLRPVALLKTEHVQAEPPTYQVSEFNWKKLPRLLQPIFSYGVRRDVMKQLRNLKRLLEPGARTFPRKRAT